MKGLQPMSPLVRRRPNTGIDFQFNFGHLRPAVLVDIAVMVQLPVDGSMPRLDRAMLLKEAEQWRLAGAAGLFVSPPPELPAPTCPPLSTDDQERLLIEGFMTLSKKYGPTQWLGVRPRTLPQPEEAEGGPVQWMLQRCSSAAGIYLDVEVMHTANASEGAAAGKEVPVGAQTTKTKDTWRNVTRVRATAEWPGLYFGRVANGVTSALLEDERTYPLDPADPGAFETSRAGGKLGHLARLTTHLMDVAVVAAPTEAHAARVVRCMQEARPAFVVEMTAPVTNDHLVVMARGCDAVLIDAHFTPLSSATTLPTPPADPVAATNIDFTPTSTATAVESKIACLAKLGLLSPLLPTPSTTTAAAAAEAGSNEKRAADGGGGGGGGGGGVIGLGPAKHIHVKGAGGAGELTSVVPDSERTPAGRAFLDSVLNKCLRVTLTDGRVIQGRLICTDRDSNLVMAEGQEHAPASFDAKVGSPIEGEKDGPQLAAADTANESGYGADGLKFRRRLGLTMVPGEHIVNVSLEQRKT